MTAKPLRLEVLFLPVLTLSAIAYFFFIPDNLDSQHEAMKHGYWGIIDTDLDWCEFNHTVSSYIAEPVNSITGIIYILIAVFAFIKHQPLIMSSKSSSDHDIVALILLLAFLGVATTTFHSTLKYSMQVLDELSIAYFLTHVVLIFYFQIQHQRVVAMGLTKYKDSKLYLAKKMTNLESKAYYIKLTNFMFNVCVTVFALQTSDKDAIVHVILRAYLPIVFVAMALGLYFFTRSMFLDIASKEDEMMMVVSTRLEKARTKGLKICIISFLFWLIDNFCCQYLQNMPFNIPYLHLHGLGWHIGSSITLYFAIYYAILHRVCVIQKIEEKNLQFKSHLFGLLPYVVVNLKSKPC